MSATFDAEAMQRRINSYSPYVGARIEITHVAEDASEIRVRMPLVEENANLVGTQFGGSLYAMVDPHLMILLMQRLGPEYVVWDKSATIHFLRPGRGTVRATIRISDQEVEEIARRASDGEVQLPEWDLHITNEEGKRVARVHKVLYVRKKPD